MSFRNRRKISSKVSHVARSKVIERAVRPVVAGFEPLEGRVLMSVAAHYYNDGFWGRGDGNRPEAPSSDRPFPDQAISVNRAGDVVTSVNQIAFDYGGGSPDPAIRGDNHSTVFVGKIVAPEAGDYEILGFGDDDTHVFVGGQLVSADPGGHGIEDPRSAGSVGRGGGAAIVPLTAGAHDLLVVQAEQGGGSGVFLRWITPTMVTNGETTPVNVPAANLTPDNAAPDAPTNVARTTTDVDGVTPLPATEIAITFTDNSTEELRYELERKLTSAPDSAYTRLPRVAAINAGRISDLGALAGQSYTYRVVAVNFAGRTPSTSTVTATGAATVPTAPTDVTVTPGSNFADIAFTDASNNETGFEILRSRTNDIANATVVGTVPADGTTFTVGGLLPGTESFFFVRAINDAGTASSPGVAGTTTNPELLDLSTVPAGPGALARFYNSQARQGTPALVRVDPQIAFDFGNGSPGEGVNADNHSGLWTGQITPPQTGTYRFITATDDGAFLYVDGVQVVNDPTFHGIFDRLADRTINLTAGVPVNFQFEFFEGGGGSGAFLKWIRPDGVRETLPASVFTSNRRSALAAPTGLAASNVDNNQATITFTNDNTSAQNFFGELSTGSTFNANNVVREFSSGADGSPLVLNGLTPNTQYTLRLRAFNDETGLTSPATITFMTAATGAVPAAPSIVRVIPRVGSTALSFTDNSFNETGFIIERSVNGGPFVQAGTVGASAPSTSGGVLTFIDTTATAGQNLVFRVRAAGQAAPAGGGDSVSVTSTSVLVPTPGTGLRERAFDDIDFTGNDAVPEPVESIQPVIDENFGGNAPAEGLGADQFSIIYDGSFVAEVTGSYRFGLSSDDGVSMLLLNPTTGAPLINFNNLGARRGADFGNPQDIVGPVNLVAGTRYPVEFRLVEDGGGAGIKVFQSIEGGPFETLPGATLFPQDPNAAPMFAPLNLRGTALGLDRITLSFDDFNFTETGFEIERGTSATGPFTLAGTVPANGNSLVVNGPFTADTPVFFRVRGTGAGGTFSPFSPVVSVTPVDPTTETRTDLTLNGTARFITVPTEIDDDGEALQLTDNVNGQTGTAFLTNARNVDRDFVSKFSFQIPEGNGADGFAFVLQSNSPNAVGGGGGSLGAQGIPNSLIVKFDIFENINQTGVYLNGEPITNLGADLGFEIDNGNVYEVTLTYNADSGEGDLDADGVLDTDSDSITIRVVNLTDNTAVPFEQTFSTSSGDSASGFDIDTLLGGDNAFVGFSGATGGLNAEQNILDFSFNGQDIPLRGATTTATIDAVYVRSASWSADFKTFLEAKGLGDDVYGYRADTVTSTLPWINMNQIVLHYSSPISAAGIPTGGTVVLDGQQSDYTVTAVAQLDPQSVVLTLNRALGIQPAGSPDITLGDRVKLTVPGAGAAGSAYNLTLNVLQGDADRSANQRVATTDVNFVKARLNRIATEVPPAGATYTAFADLNGDGRILTADINAAKARLNDVLPPAATTSGSVATASITRDLFSSTAII